MPYLPRLRNRCREFLGSEWFLQERDPFEAVAQHFPLCIPGGEDDRQAWPGFPCRPDHLDPAEPRHRMIDEQNIDIAAG